MGGSLYKPAVMPAYRPGTTPPLSLDHLLGLMDAAQQGIGVFDQTDTLVYANDFYRQLLDLEPGTWPAWKDILHANYRDQAGNRISTADFEAWLASASSRRGKQPFRAFEADMHGGRWIHVAETTLGNGWMLCVLTDITELATDERTLRQQRDLALRAALTDPLTGLGNRRHMQDALAALYAQCLPRPAALVLLDIDHFKGVNDNFGHDQGDLLLRHFAGLVQAQVRREDLAARWGGEEFLLLLRDIDPGDVHQIVEHLLAQVRASQPLPRHPDFRYTCSAGVAFPRPGEAVHQTLRRADAALYQAKSSGRDRWVAG